MLKALYPHEYVDSVFDIDYDKLYDMGYRGIIFDIDNTLVHHGDDSNEEIDELFRAIRGIGFKTLLLSNNSEERIKRFNINIGSMYIYDAQKPDTANFLKAVDMLGLKKNEVALVGDQIFTDIYGANKSGIDSILVKFLRRENETKIGKRRTLEKAILKFYKLNRSCQRRMGGVSKGGETRYAMEQR